MSTAGSRQYVRTQLVHGIVSVSKFLKFQGLTMSPKSVASCAHAAYTKMIVQQLRRKGIQIQGCLQLACFGVDLGAGRRQARATARKRVVKSSGHHSKLRRYARASCRYDATAKVQKAGPQAAAVHGHQVHGCVGAAMTLQRRRLAAAASSARRGRCATTLLALRLPGSDPGLVLPRQALAQWLQVWRTEPRLQAGIERVWASTIQTLTSMSEVHRSRHIRGPISATIAYLLHAGWLPTSAAEWDTTND
eukprot:7699707-Pyramimonas_sp.AAC.1